MPLILTTPYVAALTVDPSSFILHFDGTNNGTTFTSVSGLSPTKYGLPVTSTEQQKFGTSSLKLPSTSGGSVGLQYDVGETLRPIKAFTAECWIYQLTTSAWAGLLSQWFVGDPSLGSWAMTMNAWDQVGFSFATGSSQITVQTNVYIGTNVWRHVATTWDGTTIRMFIDGVLSASAAYSGQPNAAPKTTKLSIGCLQVSNSGVSWPVNGYIDEVRISTGTAYYTSSFTPPTAPF